jgi:hypothetical protein
MDPWIGRRGLGLQTVDQFHGTFLYDVELHLWIVESVGLQSIMMRGGRSMDQCHGLSMDWIGGDGWIPLGDVDSHARIC